MASIVEKWVEEQAKLTKPDRIHWVQGTEEEMRRLVDIGIKEEKTGGHPTFQPLNPAEFPNSYIHRSHPTDVAEDRAPHLRLSAKEGRRRPEQQLDGTRRGLEEGPSPL